MKTFACSLLALILLCPLSIQAGSPWPLPLLTGGASELQVSAADWTALRREYLQPLPAGWEARVGVISEDTLRVTSDDEDTDLSATGWEGALNGDAPRLGHLRYRTGMREVSMAFRSRAEVNTLRLDMRTQSLLLATPERHGWRVGVEATDFDADGDGVASGLSGIIGKAPEPAINVELAQSAILVQTERRFGNGGLFLGAGSTSDHTTLTLTDTHIQQVPLTYDGRRYRYGGWAAMGAGTLELTLVSGDADGDDRLSYDGSENGQISGTQHLRQGLLSYTMPRTRYSLGYADFSQRRRGFGVKPDTNGFTVLANGDWQLKTRFGEVRHRWGFPHDRVLELGYQLHRLHLTATGIYRAGYVGGLLETDRGSGAADERAWLHDVTLDASTPLGPGRLGYRGQVTVPLIDNESGTPGTQNTAKERVRGGLSHTLYWAQQF